MYNIKKSQQNHKTLLQYIFSTYKLINLIFIGNY